MRRASFLPLLTITLLKHVWCVCVCVCVCWLSFSPFSLSFTFFHFLFLLFQGATQPKWLTRPLFFSLLVRASMETRCCDTDGPILTPHVLPPPRCLWLPPLSCPGQAATLFKRLSCRLTPPPPCPPNSSFLLERIWRCYLRHYCFGGKILSLTSLSHSFSTKTSKLKWVSTPPATLATRPTTLVTFHSVNKVQKSNYLRKLAKKLSTL